MMDVNMIDLRQRGQVQAKLWSVMDSIVVEISVLFIGARAGESRFGLREDVFRDSRSSILTL
jgi:hypothetical protein